MRRPLQLLAIAIVPQLLPAQGITTAAIQGTVVSEDETPVAGAHGCRVAFLHPADGNGVLIELSERVQ